MKLLNLISLLIAGAITSGFSQTEILCSYKYLDTHEGNSEILETRMKVNCDSSENEFAIDKIQTLMDLVNLPMNFEICKGDNVKAYAKRNAFGIRQIVYDELFLNDLDEDSLRLQSTAVLAHEIGHHVLAHTINIIDDNFQQKKDKYCDSMSLDFNIEICKREALKYYSHRRIKEAEADRFAGYLMYRYGATLDDIMIMLDKLLHPHNDPLSTHPTKSIRKDAVKEGYNLAASHFEVNQTHLDLEELKDTTIKIDFKNISRIERNKLIEKIEKAAFFEPREIINKINNDELGYGSGGYLDEFDEKIINYHGQENQHWFIDNDEEFFKVSNQFLFVKYDDVIRYWPVAAIHINNNILKILIFNTPGEYKIVYTSPFSENHISLREIRSIFIEIYKEGIRKEIEKASQ